MAPPGLRQLAGLDPVEHAAQPLHPQRGVGLAAELAHGEGPRRRREIRLPTRLLAVTLDLPVSADPVVWGVRSSLWHGDVPLRTPITHEVPGDDRVVFTWQTDRTALQERYRLEWRFRNDPGGVTARAPGHGQPA